MEPELECGKAPQRAVHLRRGNLWPSQEKVAFLHAERLHFPPLYDARRKSVSDLGGHRRRFHAGERQTLLEAEGLIDGFLLQDAGIHEVLSQT